MEPIVHMRRPMANHSWCDPGDERVFADFDEVVTCEACKRAYETQSEEWYEDLANRGRMARLRSESESGEGED